MEFISAIFHFLLPERLAGLISPLWFQRTWRKRHSSQYFLETSKTYSLENTSRDIKKVILGKKFQPMGAGDPTTSQPWESSIWSRDKASYDRRRQRLLPPGYKGPINTSVKRPHSQLSMSCQIIKDYYFQCTQKAAVLVADIMWRDDFQSSQWNLPDICCFLLK